ncbi:MAG: hypothetical protein K2H43_05865, partial [Clostridia bacterium]|nr:hypothetical protein [Clostridia bacterium]
MWLANTSSSNDVSNQEIGCFTDGTERFQQTISDSNALRYSENGSTPVYVFSNNYDSSYLRHWLVLGGSDNYIENWGQVYNVRNSHGAANHASENIIPYETGVEEARPAGNTLTKFDMFQNAGALEKYLVTPSEMPWQMNLSAYKNDPSYATGGAPGASQYGKYHTSFWVNDKVWIPSTGEVYAKQYSSGAACDGGLWNTNATQRDNSTNTWLRTAVYWTSQISTQIVENLTPTGGSIYKNADPSSIAYRHAVRPAIHLNLSKLNIVETPKVTSTLTYNRSSQSVVFDSNYDCTKMEITGITRTGGTANVAATYTNAAAGSSAGTMPEIKVTDAGEYTITLKSKPLNSSTTECWLFSDTGTDTTTVKFTVSKATLETPGMGTKSKEYDGSTQIFTATNYITQTVSASPPYP